jgi:hypothetical protein
LGWNFFIIILFRHFVLVWAGKNYRNTSKAIVELFTWKIKTSQSAGGKN